MKPLRQCKSLPDQVLVLLRRGDTPLRLLLKDVQDVDRVRKMSSLDRAICIGSIPLDNLQDPRSAKALYQYTAFGIEINGEAFLLSEQLIAIHLPFGK